jgi:hypothetical protein
MAARAGTVAACGKENKMANGSVEKGVPPADAIGRIIDAFVAEKSAFYESRIRPMLAELDARLVSDLKEFFNYEFIDKDELAQLRARAGKPATIA